ncbi:VOC family protein [Leucobacter tardus]|uniref:VOC family protein n=1 Tax=Leucobacter tardus TaxID=501483 RepID=A0A939QBU4_9MICO|nr:VOC family protein [Leucobacter tardus]MBO2989330.1 VOC family protein [Leucobacter tardus]
MTVPQQLDHIVIAGPDLDALVAWFADRTGVTAAPGGAHPTGTANALIALTIDGARGPQYLELIGPDPDRGDPGLPSMFGIDRLSGPTVQTYAVHPADIEATVAEARERGVDLGEVADLSRHTPNGELLEWRLAGVRGPRREIPFVIDWGGTPHPGLGDMPLLELRSFTWVESDATRRRELSAALGALGLGVGAAEVVDGSDSGFRLELVRADGGTAIL